MTALVLFCRHKYIRMHNTYINCTHTHIHACIHTHTQYLGYKNLSSMRATPTAWGEHNYHIMVQVLDP